MKSPIPLKGYLSLLFGIVAIVPIITIAVLVWFFVMPSIQSRTGNQHQALARSIAGQISTYLEGGERQLIQAVLGRIVPAAPKGLPLDDGVVVLGFPSNDFGQQSGYREYAQTGL